jgi:PncC family amidohydrolase
MVQAASEAGRLLLERGWLLATAESCTGGLIGHLVTNVPGSSRFYLGGAIAYANAAKETLLGVPPEVIAAYGAVSAPVARAMAEGVTRVLAAQVGLSVTGIAGPTGGTPDKPVGTVFIGLASPWGTAVEHHVWPYGREANKAASACRALEMLVDLLRRP